MEDICVKNIFFHSVVCFSTFLAKSFDEQMFLNFLFCFLIMIFKIVACFKKNLSYIIIKIFSLLFSKVFIALPFTFRPTIYLGLIFEVAQRILFFSNKDIQLILHHFFKRSFWGTINNIIFANSYMSS